MASELRNKQLTGYVSVYTCDYLYENLNSVRPCFLQNTTVSYSILLVHATHMVPYACAIQPTHYMLPHGSNNMLLNQN